MHKGKGKQCALNQPSNQTVKKKATKTKGKKSNGY